MRSVEFDEHKLRARLCLIMLIARLIWAINFSIVIVSTVLRHWELVVLAMTTGVLGFLMSAVTQRVFNMLQASESHLVWSEYAQAGSNTPAGELYVEE
ncbi:MAG: hypothetical protein ACOX3G_08970 [Armatimonadota bacterium]|jgi:hypothetical protein